MESLQGSWQHEGLSSAEESIQRRPPSSPTLYSPNNKNSNNNTSSTKLKGGDVSSGNTDSGIFDQLRRQDALLSNGRKLHEGSIIIGNGETLLSAAGIPGISQIFISNATGPSSQQQYQEWMSDVRLNDMLEMSDLGILNEQSLNLEGFDDIWNTDELITGNNILDEDLNAEPTKPWSVETAVINESSIALSLDHQENISFTLEETVDDKFPFQVPEESLDDQENIKIFSHEDLNQLVNEGFDLGLETVEEYDQEEGAMDVDEEGDSESASNNNNSSNESVEIVFIAADDDDAEEEEDKEEEEEEDDDDDSSFSASNSPGYAVSLSQPSSVSSSSYDSEDETQEKTVDALLQGRFKTASALYPESSSAVQEGKAYARILCSSRRGRPSSRSAVDAAALMLPKPERRGRKPSSATVNGKSWVHVKDKTLRKKEQNKTAATRYRQKKKLETMKFLEQEKKLIIENTHLKKDREDLRKEISVIKNLLQTLFKSKKQNRLERRKR